MSKKNRPNASRPAAKSDTPTDKASKDNAANPKPSTISKILNIESLFLFFIFPLAQIIDLFLMTQEIHTLYKLPLPAFIAIVPGTLLFLILIAYIIHRQHSKKQTARNYQELLNIQQYQKKHYDTIQQQRIHLENITKSFEEQLKDISLLLDKDDAEKALELLRNLTAEIEATMECPFCPNPVINAVLSNMERVCREHQIAFQADMQIGACTSVDKLHLCSIFSNLLDNALEANKKIEPPDGRYIHLTALQNGDYLHIKVRNASPAPASPKEGHGYGQKILNDIAAKYAGSFQRHYENHIYEAYLCIQMP